MNGDAGGEKSLQGQSRVGWWLRGVGKGVCEYFGVRVVCQLW